MLTNYLKIAWRNLLKNKVFSLINIAGLAIGMAACFFIFQYVRFELSYDTFHTNADRLYRVPMNYRSNVQPGAPSAATHPGTGPQLLAEFPDQVEDFVRLAPPSVFAKSHTFSYSDDKGHTKRFNESKFFVADASFLTMFSFPFVAGNPQTALLKPYTVVISETIAKKYFGHDNPLNKTVRINETPLTVTGVFTDVPENSHIHFDLLISMTSLGEKWNYNDFGWPEFYNYVLLKPNADPKKVAASLPAFGQRHLNKAARELKFRMTLHLQPIKDIHLKSNCRLEPEAQGSETTVYFLSLLGALILIIAWINYINLSTAKSMERAMEVGLRKVVGATRWQLVWQFILESFIINGLALALSVVIIITGAPYFDQLVGKNISGAFLSSGLLQQWQFWGILLGVFILGAIQVGAFPAFILSAFRPILVLKGKLQQSGKGVFFRKALVTCQFALSIMLLAGTIVVYKQLHYMQNRELGYNKDQVMVVKSPAVFDSTFNTRVNYFKAELLRNAAISHMAPSSEIPGKTIFGKNGVRRPMQDKSQAYFPFLVEIDKDFVPTYGMQLVAGRNLPDRESGNIFETKQSQVLINETVVHALGFANNEAAIHEKVLLTSWFGEINCEIVGVVKNHHQRSLKEKYDPILYYHNSRSNWGYFSININTHDLKRNIAYVEKLYHSIFPGNAFESFFLNDYFNRQYDADQQFGYIFGLFTALAIFIACLGLIGLSTYAIKIRSREIGIRKVLGASVQGLVYLFSIDFIRLVGIAAVIAIPVIYLLADRWLQNFAFHIQLSWFIFVIAPVCLLVISLLTISIQSIKAAFTNPVKVLRNQ
jgi:putative ABC transport system permease protein